MNRWLRQVAGVVVLSLGLAAGHAQAQAPEPSAPMQTSVETAPEDLLLGPAQGPAREPARPFRNHANDKGYCCWAHPNTVGCSSLRSDLHFIFSSCRSFFGEPCLSPPPEAGGIFRKRGSGAGGCQR